MNARLGVAAALDSRPEEFAAACRDALESLEGTGELRDADRALREIAIALADLTGIRGVVPARTNRALAVCDAPNCAGHRLRA